MNMLRRISLFVPFILLFSALYFFPTSATPLAPIFTATSQELVYPTGNSSNDVALGDIDQDGDVDAFVVQGSFGSAQDNVIWLNDGSASFSAGSQFVGGGDSQGIALGDLDGDNDLDAFIANAGFGINNDDQVWINQGGAQPGTTGTYTVTQTLTNGSSQVVLLASFDDDTDLDALILGDVYQIWWNDGSGTFSAGPIIPIGYANDAAVGDFDQDTDLDIVFVGEGNLTPSQVYWNEWEANGSFTAGPTLITEGVNAGVAVGHLDDDNNPDIYIATSQGNVVWWNNGDDTFTAGTPMGNRSDTDVVLGDYDDDSDLDAFVTRRIFGQNDDGVWLNNNDRTFTASEDALGTYTSLAADTADLNSDGHPDIFVANSGPNIVYLNQGPVVSGGPADWRPQTIDTRANTGLGADMVLDNNGFPIISYVQQTTDEGNSRYRLNVARWNGLTWQTYQIEAAAGISPQTALALDANGYPHLAYVTASKAFLSPDGSPGNITDGELHYAWWDGAQWQRQTLWNTTEVGGFLDLALETPNIFHISFFDHESDTLQYAAGTPDSWGVSQVHDGRLSEFDAHSSIALAPDGTPHIIYYASPDNLILHASHNGSDWDLEQIENINTSFGGNPSLVIDSSGTLHTVYAAESDALHYATNNGSGWQIEPVGRTGEWSSLALDSGGTLHMRLLSSSGGIYLTHVGGSWQTVHTDNGRYGALALDDNDQPHIAYHQPTYGNLVYETIDPLWQITNLDTTNEAVSPSLIVDNTLTNGHGPWLSYYVPTQGLLQFASWMDNLWGSANTWDVQNIAFINNAAVTSSINEFAFADPAVSYYDADNQRLMYTLPADETFIPQVVDNNGDVGRHSTLLPNKDIVYWDATNRRIKIAEWNRANKTWHLFSNTVGPALNDQSGFPQAVQRNFNGAYVSYYDGVNGDLRLARWDGTTWADQLIDGTTADVGRLHSIALDTLTNQPAVAYYDTTNQRIQYAYRTDSGWQIETALNSVGSLDSLNLQLDLDSAAYPHISYINSAGTFVRVIQKDGGWLEPQTIVSGANLGLRDVTADHNGQHHIAYATSSGVGYTFTTVRERNGHPLPPTNPFFPGVDCLEELEDSLFRSTAAVRAPTAASPDADVYQRMDAAFSATTEGQRYIDLYQTHVTEMATIGLNDPQLLGDGYQTMQNFMPGLTAFTLGHGDQYTITQQMADDALDIWTRLSTAAGPELANVIDTELATYNNLQDFVGLSFDEWAQMIGVTPPQPIYLPLVATDTTP